MFCNRMRSVRKGHGLREHCQQHREHRTGAGRDRKEKQNGQMTAKRSPKGLPELICNVNHARVIFFFGGVKLKQASMGEEMGKKKRMVSEKLELTHCHSTDTD